VHRIRKFIQRLQRVTRFAGPTTKHVVIFTGAGVSAESGIPTFRDALTGLWERFDAEDLATPNAFSKDKDLVWGWYPLVRREMCRLKSTNPGIASQIDLCMRWGDLENDTLLAEWLKNRARQSIEVLDLARF
jgi:NAD-dependent SIR2 family protein deacetylase